MTVQFGTYPLRIKSDNGVEYILDPIRRKWILLTSEEQVRQIWLQYLIHDKDISPSRIAVEKGININNKRKRFDVCVYDMKLNPYLLMEFKEPSSKLKTPDVEQLSIYNIELGAKKFVLSNGIEHLGFEISKDQVKKLNTF